MIFVAPQYFYLFDFLRTSISRIINVLLKQFSNNLMQGAESRQTDQSSWLEYECKDF